MIIFVVAKFVHNITNFYQETTSISTTSNVASTTRPIPKWRGRISSVETTHAYTILKITPKKDL